ncbi:YitT family protein [Ligilactobacillus ceti]|nr:YitT family protein [Ligilactobacillus ceti]
MITLSCALFGFGIVKFNMANNLASSGVAGLALIVRYWLHIDPAYTTMVLNVPLLIIGYRYLGKKSLFYTIWGTVMVSVWIWLWQRIPINIEIHHDLFIAGLSTGLVGGLGAGMLYRFDGTSGGTDIIARILEKKKGIPMGKSLLMMDVVVLALSLSYMDLRQMLYTLLASYVFANMVNIIQDAGYSAKGVIIISDEHEAIADAIMHDLVRGVSYLHAEGAFSHKDKKVIYCIMDPSEITTLKRLIDQYDKNAFVSISDVNEVLGSGFTYDTKKKKKKIFKKA